jgi:hypothetical protein
VRAHERERPRQASGRPPAAAGGVRPAADGLAGLQQTIGNRAVVALLQRANVAAGTAVTPIAETVGARVAQPEVVAAARAFAVQAMRDVLADDAVVNAKTQERNATMAGLIRNNPARLASNQLDPNDVQAVRQAADPVLQQAALSANADDRRPSALDAAVRAAILVPGDADKEGTRRWLVGELAVETAILANERAKTSLIQGLLARNEGANFGQEPTVDEKRAWSAALRRLPAVASVAQAHRSGRLVTGLGGGPQWANAGSLADDIQEDATDDKKRPVPPNKQFRAPIDDHTFEANVRKADHMLKTLLEAGVLGLLNRPTIRVHPQHSSGFKHPWGFRAYQSGNNVHVAADESVAIIVHEVGHYIETNGPRDTWIDIQKLLHQRHQAAGGGAVKKGGVFTSSEGRLGGTYGATGSYTSTVYTEGSTEVMSMTLEYLSNPDKFASMLDDDPKQAAIVLRGVQPLAYAGENTLRAFDRFLPSG